MQAAMSYSRTPSAQEVTAIHRYIAVSAGALEHYVTDASVLTHYSYVYIIITGYLPKAIN